MTICLRNARRRPESVPRGCEPATTHAQFPLSILTQEYEFAMSSTRRP